MNDELLITLIFAAIAAFVIFKLRSVLGRRTGHEPPPNEEAGFGATERRASTESNNDNIISMPEHLAERMEKPEPAFDPDSPAAAGVADIQALDPAFDPHAFVKGAESAFRMIVEAFASGDRQTLEQLLAPDVYQSFEAAITDREQANETLEQHIERFRASEIVEAETVGRDARVTVLFVTEQSSATRNAAGAVVDGDPDAVETISDLWTFSRDTSSSDPNWELVDTASPEE